MTAAQNEIKQALTAWVQNKLADWEHDAPAVVGSVTIRPISSTQTVVLVKTENSGTCAYRVSVSEIQ